MIVINRGRNGKLRENSGYSNEFLPYFNSKTLKFWLTRKFSSKKLLLTFLGTKNEAILLSAVFVLVVADQVFTLQQIVKECWECTKDVYICFLDINKALCTTRFLVKNVRNCCSSTQASGKKPCVVMGPVRLHFQLWKVWKFQCDDNLAACSFLIAEWLFLVISFNLADCLAAKAGTRSALSWIQRGLRFRSATVRLDYIGHDSITSCSPGKALIGW